MRGIEERGIVSSARFIPITEKEDEDVGTASTLGSKCESYSIMIMRHIYACATYMCAPHPRQTIIRCDVRRFIIGHPSLMLIDACASSC